MRRNGSPLIDLVALARTLHGHVGLLAAIALLHPAITLGPPRRAPTPVAGAVPEAAPAGTPLPPERPLRAGTRWSVAVATALVTATVGAGWLLYPGYRSVDKPRLLQNAFPVARLFETKEHLAFYALVLAWGGCALVFAERRGAPAAPSRRIARGCFAASAALAVLVGVLGSIVASARGG